MRQDIPFKNFSEKFDGKRILVIHRKAKGDDIDDAHPGVDLLFFHPEGLATIFGVGLERACVELRTSHIVLRQCQELHWQSLWTDNPAYSPLVLTPRSDFDGVEQDAGCGGHRADFVHHLFNLHWQQGHSSASEVEAQDAEGREALDDISQEALSVSGTSGANASKQEGVAVPWCALGPGSPLKVKVIFRPGFVAEDAFKFGAAPVHVRSSGKAKKRNSSKRAGRILRRLLGKPDLEKEDAEDERTSISFFRLESEKMANQCAILPSLDVTFSAEDSFTVAVKADFRLPHFSMPSTGDGFNSPQDGYCAHDNFSLAFQGVDENAAELRGNAGHITGRSEVKVLCKGTLEGGPQLWIPDDHEADLATEERRQLLLKRMQRQLQGHHPDEDEDHLPVVPKMSNLLITDQCLHNMLAIRASFEQPLRRFEDGDAEGPVSSASISCTGDYVVVYPGCRRYKLKMERSLYYSRSRASAQERQQLDDEIVQSVDQTVYLKHSLPLFSVPGDTSFISWRAATGWSSRLQMILPRQ